MTGHSLRALLKESGYFHVWLAATKRDSFFQDNLEKLFFLTQLKSLFGAQPKAVGQGSCPPAGVALLAYSLGKGGVHLLIQTERRPLMECLARTLITRFSDYLTQQPRNLSLTFDTLFITDRLSGAHEALNVSREIHLLHDDWRHARYSSIGFYLDGREAHWMQQGRLTRLFDHEPARYLQLLCSRRTESDRIFEFIET